jgi:hypothetical protein
MECFYDVLFEAGYPQCIHQGSPGKFGRHQFVSAFWKANKNLGVCCGCDFPRPDEADGRHYDDTDHFLPKSKYPFLSVHPLNLVPLCLPCNRTFKKQRDPIDNHTAAPLINTFHPYKWPAIDQITVQVARDSKGKEIIRIKDSDGTTQSRRVKRLNELLKLEARWAGGLHRHAIDPLREDVVNWIRWASKRGLALSTADIEHEVDWILQELARQYKERIGKQPYNVLREGYLRYVLSDRKEYYDHLIWFKDNLAGITSTP